MGGGWLMTGTEGVSFPISLDSTTKRLLNLALSNSVTLVATSSMTLGQWPSSGNRWRHLATMMTLKCLVSTITVILVISCRRHTNCSLPSFTWNSVQPLHNTTLTKCCPLLTNCSSRFQWKSNWKGVRRTCWMWSRMGYRIHLWQCYYRK